MSLCVNAGQAMPAGGELVLALEAVCIDESSCRAHADCQPGDYVCLTVGDTGAGMPPDVLARIFEPFFSTREVGKGSEFKVYLPIAEENVVQEAPEVSVGGKETLLLVEDEESVLAVGQQMLETLGYTVLTARDGSEGLETFLGRQQEIDLVLTDVVMPKMDGIRLCQSIKQIDSGVAVLLMSGYPLRQDGSEIQASGADGIVRKPFSLSNLDRELRRVLDE